MQRNCPVCGDARHRAIISKPGLTLVRCDNCSMVYANPIGTDAASGSLYEALAAPYYLSPEKLQNDYSPVRFQRELRLFRRFCRHGKVRDVGCSTGAFLFQIKQRYPSDYEIAGNDIVGPALDHAQGMGVPVVRESFLDIRGLSACYDAITFWAVMEHLPHPKRFLEKAVDMLKAGGLCFILVPNFQSLAVRVLGAKYRYILDQHVNYFTHQTLRQLVKETQNVRLIHTEFTHFNPLVIWQDWRQNGQPVPDHERARLLQKTTNYKQNPLLFPVKLALSCLEGALKRLNLSDNIVIIVQKNSA